MGRQEADTRITDVGGRPGNGGRRDRDPDDVGCYPGHVAAIGSLRISRIVPIAASVFGSSRPIFNDSLEALPFVQFRLRQEYSQLTFGETAIEAWSFAANRRSARRRSLRVGSGHGSGLGGLRPLGPRGRTAPPRIRTHR